MLLRQLFDFPDQLLFGKCLHRFVFYKIRILVLISLLRICENKNYPQHFSFLSQFGDIGTKTTTLPKTAAFAPPSGLRRFLRALGPGLIIAALVFGPGSLTVASKLGAGFGYALLWVVPAAIVFMIAFTLMAGKIGLATDQTLMQLIREKYGPWPARLIGVGVFLITAAFQAGNSVGVGIAFGALFDTPPTAWIVLFTAMGAALLFFRSFYTVLEKIMIALVGLMLVAFFSTLIASRPDLGELLRGFAPVLPAGSELLALALAASSFSIVGAFYQAYLVLAKGLGSGDFLSSRSEAITGILLLGLITLTVMGSAAAVLHPKGLSIQSAGDMAKVLEPLLGPATTTLFMLGLFGASFSSLVGNATIGGSTAAKPLAGGNRLQAIPVRLTIVGVMAVGAAVAVTFSALPLELIVFAQGVTIFVAPLIGLALLALANDRSLLKERTNNLLMNVTGGIGLLLLLGLAISYAIQIYAKFAG